MTALGPTHSNVHDACPACDGQRCQVYSTEDQANAALDQTIVGICITLTDDCPTCRERIEAHAVRFNYLPGHLLLDYRCASGHEWSALWRDPGMGETPVLTHRDAPGAFHGPDQEAP